MHVYKCYWKKHNDIHLNKSQIVKNNEKNTHINTSPLCKNAQVTAIPIVTQNNKKIV